MTAISISAKPSSKVAGFRRLPQNNIALAQTHRILELSRHHALIMISGARPSSARHVNQRSVPEVPPFPSSLVLPSTGFPPAYSTSNSSSLQQWTPLRLFRTVCVRPYYSFRYLVQWYLSRSWFFALLIRTFSNRDDMSSLCISAIPDSNHTTCCRFRDPNWWVSIGFHGLERAFCRC